ncbi:alpha-1-antichymotrypsin-like [Elephas maximus indicus]|uniref:alpha-1-antichymotrypsin-like n=1 Tax=Elephas maximus indicus TaxID=99487 RepID=UPI002116B874|nr:alpha-1-antichymotrypsin-like [Elephas maximus indicus]XP_049754419.1 alpha-1-antichymotrypsin-like [Elephas maximus indicus]
MKRMSPLLALGLLVAGLCPVSLCDSGCVLRGENGTQDKTHEDNLKVASSNINFAFSLYKKLALNTPNENVIFSPISISVALAFVSLGANSTTLTEILEGLRFNLTETPEAEIHRGFQHLLSTFNQSSNELQLSMGNAMFVDENLKLLEKFREKAQELYGAETFNVKFLDAISAAEKFINDYVKNKTRGKIVDLVHDLNPQTVMIVVNYIFFKAQWQKTFDPRGTHESKFHVSANKSVEVPMMNIENLATPYFRDEELSCTVVELKYTGAASALFILPDEGKMEEVEATLSPETLRRWRESLTTRLINELYVPKFSISGDYSLENILPQLGIREVFTSQADLSGITGAKNLMVSQVLHKAVIDVAENGTEAAAATAVQIILTSAMLEPLTIVRFNRPFLMTIFSSDTQSILFMGKVVNPKKQ